MSEKKPTKLSFKGDTTNVKTKKKKRKAEETTEAGNDHSSSSNTDGWVPVKTLADFGGPLFLTFSSDPPSCLSFDDNKSTIRMFNLSSENSVDLTTVEPNETHQVFVASMIPDSDRLTLKTHTGRYLSSDKFGIVSADSEAIGMQEEWTAILQKDEVGGLTLQSHYGKFLSVDEVADAGPRGSGFQIRADAETIGFCETFQAKIQARFRKKAKKQEVVIATKDYEFDQSRKFQTWNHGRVVVSTEDIRSLDAAKKEGRFSEALLDRRSKLKSDRYCK